MPRTQQDPRSSSPQIAGKSRGLVATVVVLLAAPSLLPGVARAQSEDQIKAAFLFHFARYVEWPASAFEAEGAPVRICLFGSGRFESVVSGVVSGKRVEGRPVEVATTEDLALAKSCHILFVGDQETQARSDVISMLGGFSVFTVSDAEGFARDGGVANFFRKQQKVRFEINPSAARRAGLKISSRLLRLARVVE